MAIKFSICDQDNEDFEQEKLIKEWLDGQGSNKEFEFKHITSKGTARDTLVKAEVRLDCQLPDSTATYADFITGFDGRDLYNGEDVDPIDYANSYIQQALSCMGFNKGEIKCLVKILKQLAKENKTPSWKSMIDLESVTPLEHFKDL